MDPVVAPAVVAQHRSDAQFLIRIARGESARAPADDAGTRDHRGTGGRNPHQGAARRPPRAGAERLLDNRQDKAAIAKEAPMTARF